MLMACDVTIENARGDQEEDRSFCLIIVSRASSFTREEGFGQLRITSLCCRLSSGQAVQGVTSNLMLIVVNRDVFCVVLAGLFSVCHTTQY